MSLRKSQIHWNLLTETKYCYHQTSWINKTFKQPVDSKEAAAPPALTCSPDRRYTLSSSSCSPAPTACCESSGVFSSESSLHTGDRNSSVFLCEPSRNLKHKSFRSGGLMLSALGATGYFLLPLWEAAGWAASRLLLPKASSHRRWESTPASTAWLGERSAGVRRMWLFHPKKLISAYFPPRFVF